MKPMSQKFPTLFGRASAGGVKIWNIRVEEVSKTLSHIIIDHGAEGGKQQSTTRKVTEGKNLGKANETTPLEQALAEAQSLWAKKQDKGYTLSKTAVSGKEEATTLLPMLAHKFNERKHNLVWPAFVQPKLNGIRCLIKREGDTITFHSRGNKTFMTLGHLVKDALAIMNDGDILDGELYSHEGLSLQEIGSLVKNDSNPDIARVEKYLQFWNYDRCEDLPFRVRHRKIKAHGSIRLVPTYQVADEKEVRAYHGKFIQDGFEGTMIRSGGDEGYVFQYRSTTLLKLKDFIDDEFEIVGAEEGDGKAEGQATFVVKTKDGKEFKARCKGANSVREEQWTNRKNYIGKMLTVRWPTFLSDDGIPLCPVGVVVRDYE